MVLVYWTRKFVAHLLTVWIRILFNVRIVFCDYFIEKTD
jgi:hypothetical protein